MDERDQGAVFRALAAARRARHTQYLAACLARGGGTDVSARRAAVCPLMRLVPMGERGGCRGSACGCPSVVRICAPTSQPEVVVERLPDARP